MEMTQADAKRIVFDCKVDRMVNVTRESLREFQSVYGYPHASNFCVGGHMLPHMLALQYQTTVLYRPTEDVWESWISRKLQDCLLHDTVYVALSPDEHQRLLKIAGTRHEEEIRKHVLTIMDVLEGQVWDKSKKISRVYFIGSPGGDQVSTTMDSFRSILMSIIAPDDFNKTDAEFVIIHA